MFIALLALALQVQAAPATVPADSYADSATADLVARARAARERNERLVTSYTVRASSRLGVGIRALSRDRMIYRQELVADIEWRRDSVSTVTVVGAREAVPIATKGDQLPEGLNSEVRDLIIDPASDYLRLLGDESDGFSYPLRDGGENEYRFARGGVTTITLGTGKRIELVALRIIPRRADFRLINGTFWFDNETANIVRAVFRPARPFEMRRDLDEEDLDDTPSWVNAGAEVKFVTLEYGLYDNRWWMPRFVAIDATGTMGSWLKAPFRMERTYEDYEVQGGTPPDSNSTFVPAGRDQGDRRGRREARDSIAALIDDCVDRASEELERAPADQRVAISRRIGECAALQSQSYTNLTIVLPDDTLSLVTSPELGEPILDMGDLISENEIRSLASAIQDIPDRPWDSRLMLPDGIGAILARARYNRIESLSLGVGGTLDWGRVRLDGEARIGLADGEPNGSLSFVRPTLGSSYSVTAYRRLAAANPDANPLGPINSFMGIVAGRDDGEYFRTTGVELTGGNNDTRWWSGRLFHEQQRTALVSTRASIPGLFDGDRGFRSNIVANDATQTGAELRLRTSKQLSRTVTMGIEGTVDGAIGDYEFARTSGTARLFYTQGGPIAAAMTISAGTSSGELPRQSLFYLGGPSSLRGYAGGVAAGTAYWYGRAEIGNGFPALRLIGFTDVGWAGDRVLFGKGNTLWSAGAGVSTMDGLVRFDLSRALRSPTGWRLDFYIDGAI